MIKMTSFAQNVIELGIFFLSFVPLLLFFAFGHDCVEYNPQEAHMLFI